MTVASVHSSSALPAPLLSPEAREDLHRYAEAGGFTLRAETHPWYGAFDSVARMDDARAASTVLAELRGRDVPGLRRAAERLAAVPGLPAPATVTGTAAAVVLLGRIRGTLSTLQPQAYVASADTLLALAAATGTGAWRAERGVSQSWWHRTRLGRRARSLAATPRTRREELHRALHEAASAREEWASLAPADAAAPAVPQDLSFLDEAAHAAETALTGLGQLALLIQPETPLEDLPLDDLVALLDRLAADEGTLYRLPRLRELHDSLTAQGLGDLLAELTSQQADATATTLLLAQRTAPHEESLPSADDEAEPETIATAVVETEPEAEPDAVAEDLAEAEAEFEPEAAAEAETAAEPAEAAAEVEAEPAAEAKPETVDAEPEVEPIAAAEPTAAAEVAPQETEPQAVAVAEPAEDTVTETEPEATAEPVEDTVTETEAAPVDEAPQAETIDAEPEPIAAEAEPTAAAEAHTEPAEDTVAETEPEAVAEPAEDTVTETEVAPVDEAPQAQTVDAEPEPIAAEAELEAAGEVAGGVPKPEFTPGRPVTAYSAEQLEAIVRWIDADGTVRADDELLRAAMKELGFSRLGPRIKEALGAAIAAVRG